VASNDDSTLDDLAEFEDVWNEEHAVSTLPAVVAAGGSQILPVLIEAGKSIGREAAKAAGTAAVDYARRRTVEAIRDYATSKGRPKPPPRRDEEFDELFNEPPKPKADKAKASGSASVKSKPVPKVSKGREPTGSLASRESAKVRMRRAEQDEMPNVTWPSRKKGGRR
jgi:hypothetical protein